MCIRDRFVIDPKRNDRSPFAQLRMAVAVEAEHLVGQRCQGLVSRPRSGPNEVAGLQLGSTILIVPRMPPA